MTARLAARGRSVTEATVAVFVEPLRLEWIEALVAGDDVFRERFSVPVAPVTTCSSAAPATTSC